MARKKLKLLDREKVEKAANILKAMAHPMRLRIVDLLQYGEMNVGQLQEALGVSQSLTSQHLAHMRTKGLLKAHKDGKCVYYSIAMPEVIQVIHCIKKC